MPRKPINEKPMTAAERKARSRSLTLGALAVDVENAERLAGDWVRCMQAGRVGASDKDIEDAFKEIALWLARARFNVPKS